MNGMPIQVFSLTEGYVVSLRYQKKDGSLITLSHFAADSVAVGDLVKEYTEVYSARNE